MFLYLKNKFNIFCALYCNIFYVLFQKNVGITKINESYILSNKFIIKGTNNNIIIPSQDKESFKYFLSVTYAYYSYLTMNYSLYFIFLQSRQFTKTFYNIIIDSFHSILLDCQLVVSREICLK